MQRHRRFPEILVLNQKLRPQKFFAGVTLVYINKILRAKSGLFQTPPRKMHRSGQVGYQMKALDVPDITSGPIQCKKLK